MKTLLRTATPLLLSALLCALMSAPASGQGTGPRFISGAGTVDYTHPERIRPGMYAHYLIRESGGGVTQEYEQTMSVVGFDTLGSERCVWIETEFKDRGGVGQYCKTLVSLAIAGADSGTGDYARAIPEYQRRILAMSRPGADVQDMWMPKAVRLDRVSQPSPNARTELTQKRDSLPPTDVVTVAGKFHCLPSRLVRDFRASITSNSGDKRLHTQHEEMVTYRCPDVPLTGMARQTHVIRVTDGLIPDHAPADYQPPGLPKVTEREVVLVKYGLGARSAFPKDARIVPFLQPRQAEGVDSLPPMPDSAQGAKTVPGSVPR